MEGISIPNEQTVRFACQLACFLAFASYQLPVINSYMYTLYRYTSLPAYQAYQLTSLLAYGLPLTTTRPGRLTTGLLYFILYLIPAYVQKNKSYIYQHTSTQHTILPATLPAQSL